MTIRITTVGATVLTAARRAIVCTMHTMGRFAAVMTVRSNHAAAVFLSIVTVHVAPTQLTDTPLAPRLQSVAILLAAAVHMGHIELVLMSR